MIAKLVSKRVVSSALFVLTLLLSVVVADARRDRNGKIAFTSDRDGNLEIYVMNSDGTDHRRVTNNNILDSHPSWSPDGRRIAFLSQRPTGEYAIFQMNPDGSDKTEITPVAYQAPTFPYPWGWTIGWSPDGSRIAFRDANSIYTVNTDGSGRTFLTVGRSPAWSPDGSKILFISEPSFGGSLRTIRPDGTNLQTLPPLPDFYNWYYDATWSPTGSEIATTVFDGANEVVFITNADGTNPRESIAVCAARLLGCSRLAGVDWSPDGKTLAFYVLSSDEIHAQDVDGLGLRQLTNTPGRNSHPSWQAVVTAAYDFDGDGRSDMSVFRPSDSVWYLDRSNQGFAATQFGVSTDRLAPADYDGDAKTDIAVFRDGTWWMIRSSDATVAAVQFGLPGDIPVPADYTGDGRDELAVYRNGQWWALDLLNLQSSLTNLGLPTDKPVPGDYDGDGRIDQAVYRNGEWHLNRSTMGSAVGSFGLPTDRPVVGDYDGDSRDDLAVYRDGTWYILGSTQGFSAFQFGLTTDIPAPADYDGDGKADAAVYRNGTWYVSRSTGGVSIQQFGLSGDLPITAAYLP